jgi:excisionase family DNA binding protein
MVFEDAYYSINELARALKVSRATVLRRIRDGVLPPMIDGIKRFRGVDLNKAIGSGKAWRDLAQPDQEQQPDPDSSSEGAAD